ncbi:MAG: cytidylyltransferase domain-containing protein [Gammaproteobacteria bacterium]
MRNQVNNRVGIILQARTGSLRLPGKVLLPFGGSTLLGWILDRCQSAPWPLIVATTDLPQDSAIVGYCKERDATYFCGSETDVLDRYYRCAETFGFEHVIRLTADNPFTDIEELARLVTFHLERCFDYSQSIARLPVGIGAEIFSHNALMISWREGRELQHREHVNEYILENPQNFSIGCLDVPLNKRRRSLALTIDTREDYDRIRLLAETLGPSVTTEELIIQCSSFA